MSKPTIGTTHSQSSVSTTTTEKKIYRHIRIVNGIMQCHDAYRKLSEQELKAVPDKYWIDDLPINL